MTIPKDLHLKQFGRVLPVSYSQVGGQMRLKLELIQTHRKEASNARLVKGR